MSWQLLNFPELKSIKGFTKSSDDYIMNISSDDFAILK